MSIEITIIGNCDLSTKCIKTKSNKGRSTLKSSTIDHLAALDIVHSVTVKNSLLWLSHVLYVRFFDPRTTLIELQKKKQNKKQSESQKIKANNTEGLFRML